MYTLRNFNDMLMIKFELTNIALYNLNTFVAKQ